MTPRPNPTCTKPANHSAFTLTELLVVLVTIAILAMLVLPALAGVQNKGGRVQCANNLRQIGIASMIYAGEFGTALPYTHAGGNPINTINGMYYTRFVWTGAANTKVAVNSGTGSFTDTGLLYQAGLCGNGETLYCPSQWGSLSLYGENSYLPLLTSDSGGTIRGSYGYNPRVVQVSVDNRRLYQRTSQLPAHKLFAVDFYQSGSQFSHVREMGWNVLFTDGSVNFSKSERAYAFMTLEFSVSGSGAPYYNQYSDIVFDALEQDH